MMKTLAVAGLVCVAALTVGAQDADFTKWMKATGQAAGAMGKLEKKTGPEAVKHAETIGGVYENMIGFWRQRNAPDAVKLSEEGKAAAVILASAAHGGDEEKAAEAWKQVGATCRPCHDAHREKNAEGEYRIK